jgi:hypothetical protein
MRRRLIRAALAAVAASLTLVTPVLAHGDADARALARDLKAGPYVISLWQVWLDAGPLIGPHLIVMFDGGPDVSTVANVGVSVNESPLTVVRSTTTRLGWETTQGVAEGETVGISVSNGTQTWKAQPVLVTPPPTAMLPMRELIIAGIIFTIGSVCWLIGRTARAWRKPARQTAFANEPQQRGEPSWHT